MKVKDREHLEQVIEKLQQEGLEVTISPRDCNLNQVLLLVHRRVWRELGGKDDNLARDTDGDKSQAIKTVKHIENKEVKK